MARQVTCIRKQDRDNPRERITHLGGVEGGVPWSVTQEQAIRDIHANSSAYYVMGRTQTVWLIVSTSRWGNEYVRSQEDGEEQNNLLKLPQCPSPGYLG